MSLTPNSAPGASVPQQGRDILLQSGGDIPVPIPYPGVREVPPGHLSHLPAPGHLTQGQPVGTLGHVTPAGLGGPPGTPPHPPTATSGAVAVNAQSLHATGPGDGDLARSTSNPSLALNPCEGSAGKSAPASAPCGACKFLRRKCTNTCIFAPHFLPDQSPRFANVHKIFGASNVAKWLQELPVHSRDDAVNSLCYEADARIKDPVYGCVGALFALQQQVVRLQAESAAAQSELARLRALAASQASNGAGSFSPPISDHHLPGRLQPPPQLAMMPSFMPSSMPPPSAMMMNTISGFDTGQLPATLSMTMYNGTQLKAGPCMGASMLSGSTSNSANPMTLYSMSGGTQAFSSPSLPAQGGFMSAPPALKLSPQNMIALHGVPSTGSTNEPHSGTLESPGGGGFQGSGSGSVRSKRLRSEQGSTSSLAEMSPPASGSRPPSFAENNGLLLHGMHGMHGMPRYPPLPHMEPPHDLPAGYPHVPRQLAESMAAECHDPNQIVMIPQFQRSMPPVGMHQ